MSPKDVAAYVRVCKKHGVSSLKVNGLELTIDLSFVPHTHPTKLEASTDSPEAFPTTTYTDTDLLLWSTGSGYIPDSNS